MHRSFRPICIPYCLLRWSSILSQLLNRDSASAPAKKGRALTDDLRVGSAFPGLLSGECAYDGPERSENTTVWLSPEQSQCPLPHLR